jgi:hypothetical protein
LLEGRCPGIAVTLWVVGLQEKETGLRLDRHQTGLAAVEVLVQAGANLAWWHASAQTLLLLVGIGDQSILQADGQGLLGAQGRSNEAVQLGQSQEATQGPQSSVTSEVEDQMQGGDQAAEKAIAGGALQEGDEFGFEAEMLRSVQPIAQGRTG